MTSHSSLQGRLSNLSETHRVTISLINRLSRLSTQPGSSSLAGDGADARLELTAEIHQSLKEQEDALELLKQEVDDHVAGARGAEKERERARLEASVARIGEDLKLARSQFRKAQLQAKRNAENSQRKERELLFAAASSNNSNSQGRRRGQEKLSQDELLVNASGDVTAALRRTHQMMQSELSRSQFAHDTLRMCPLTFCEQSTAALATLSENYSSLDNLLSSSRSLLGTLLRTQKSDTWYLETAFYILLSTVVWLFFRRILYGPLWWLVWLPLKGLYWILGTTVGFVTSSVKSGTPASLQETTITTPILMATQQSAGGERPTFVMSHGMSIPVGGGGRGRPGPGGNPSPAPRESERSATEEVERIIDESQEQNQRGSLEAERENSEGETKEDEVVVEEEQPKPNPKKRMWEEDREAKKEEERKRDEL